MGITFIALHNLSNVLWDFNHKLKLLLANLPSVDEEIWHDSQELSEMALTERLSN